MNNIATAKYGIRFTGGTTMPQKLATLLLDGPLLVHQTSWLAVVGKSLLPAPDTNQDVAISYYLIEDILASAWVKTTDLRRLNMSYTNGFW